METWFFFMANILKVRRWTYVCSDEGTNVQRSSRTEIRKRKIKGTVLWDKFQILCHFFTEIGLTKGRGWFLNFCWGSNDFIVQKVYYDLCQFA